MLEKIKQQSGSPRRLEFALPYPTLAALQALQTLHQTLSILASLPVNCIPIVPTERLSRRKWRWGEGEISLCNEATAAE